jgi:orotidine-5'-phosphate decarboxylase
MTIRNPICVALDTPDLPHALALAGRLKGKVGYLKIGLELFYAHGAAGYAEIAKADIPIFLDLKLHDIPNTVAQGLRSLAKLGPPPAILNIHASGGIAMMQAARAAVGPSTKLIAVTILTSLADDDIWAAGFDPSRSTLDQALGLAKLTQSAGLDGVVCSPLDLVAIRAACGPDFLTIVPGIRLGHGPAHDQKRIATPRIAREAGADILVIGRAITEAADPAGAAQLILQSLS